MTKIVDQYEIRGDASHANRAAADFEQSMNKAMVSAQKSTALFQAGVTVLIQELVQLGKRALSDAVTNTLAYEKANRELTIALKNQGLESSNLFEIYSRQASKLESLTNVSDETIRSMQAMALNMGVSSDRVEQFITAAIRFSNVTGQDMQNSMANLTRTLSGQVGLMSRYLPAISQLSKEQLAAGEAVDFVNKQFEDSLFLLAGDDLTGATSGLKVAWDNFTEALGNSVSQMSVTKTALRGFSAELQTFADIANSDGFLRAVAGTFLIAVGDEDAMVRIADHLYAQGLGRGTQAPKISGAPRGDKAPIPRSPKKGDGGEFMTFGDLGGGDFALGAPGDNAGLFESNEAFQQTIAANYEVELAKQQEQNQRKADLFLQGEIEKSRLLEEQAREREEIARREADTMLHIQTAAISVGLNALTDWANGQKVALDKVIKGFLQSMGKQLIGDGIRNILMGTAQSANILTPGAGAALIAAGQAEIAAGVPMLAGGLALGFASRGGGGSGGGSLGAGGSAHHRRSGLGADGPLGSSVGAPIIVVNGALTTEDAGIAVRRALDAVERRGY